MQTCFFFVFSGSFVCFDQRTYLYEVVPAIDFYVCACECARARSTRFLIIYLMVLCDMAIYCYVAVLSKCCSQQNDGMMIEKNRTANAPTKTQIFLPFLWNSSEREYSKTFLELSNARCDGTIAHILIYLYTKHRIN